MAPRKNRAGNTDILPRTQTHLAAEGALPRRMDQKPALLMMLVPPHIRTAGGVIRRVAVPTLSARAESWRASHVRGISADMKSNLGVHSRLPPILHNPRIEKQKF